MTEKVKFKPGVGVDVGTSNIVVVRQTEDGTFVNKFHRNMLYPLDITDESADLLERSNYFFVKVSDKYYVIGEDALNLVNAIGKGNIIRPMKDGILNPSLKESSDLLFFIIKAIVGDPIVPNETLRFTIPANPVDRDIDNLFHQMVLNSFFTKLGFNPKPVNEAMCIVYDSNPTMKTDEGEVPLSGISTSWGAGMANIALSFKGMNLVEFSCTKSGDNIDEQTEKVTGLSRSKIIKIKEKKMDLANVDMSDRVQTALSIFYDETINRIIQHISNKFKDKGSEMDGEVEWVMAGGTSMVKGFDHRVEEAIKRANLPFKIYRVRKATEPFYSVGQGACIRAQADYAKEMKAK
jgi:actin-like ATPase involved in cell morphogenesis